MAKKYDWGDGKGKVHSISKAQHEANLKAKRDAKTRVASPPLGYYDPNLDAQGRAETRAYENTTDDYHTNRRRLTEDLGLARADYDLSKARTTEDYDTARADFERSTGRSLSDLLTQRTYGTQDYQTNLANLQRSYDRLANQQGEAARKAGAQATGGAHAQSARKRAANQALDRAPIDTAYNRFMEGSKTSEVRLAEDKQLGLDDLLRNYTRANQDLDTGIGRTGLSYGRGITDLDTGWERAGDEHTFYQQDLDTLRQMQWGGQAVTGAGGKVADPFEAAAQRQQFQSTSAATKAARDRAIEAARKRARKAA